MKKLTHNSQLTLNSNPSLTPPQVQDDGRQQGRSSFFALTGVALAACLLASLPARAQDADTLLQQMQNAEKTAKYSATQTSTHEGPREVARIYRDGAKRRIEWLEPTVRKGDLLVDNGTTLWLYHRAENSVTQTTSNSRVPRLTVSGAVTSQTIGGRGAYFVPGRNGRGIYIDRATKLRLGSKNSDGTTTLSNLQLGAQAAAKFTFKTPPGAKVVVFDGTLYNSINAAKRVAPWILEPAQVPAGYALESVVVGKSEGWLRYANGRNRFSLFEQQADTGEVPCQKVEGGWFWKSGGVRFLTTGISDETAIKAMASSLK